jgi:ribonuclease HI
LPSTEPWFIAQLWGLAIMDNIVENAINIFTDGSSYSGPRKGGMGILFVVINDEGHEETFELVPQGHKGANNQQMELQACVEAFDYLLSKYSPISLSEYRKVIVNTDSMYVTENFNRAKYEWPRSKWLTRDGSPVANAEIWKNLVKKAQKLDKPVAFQWVKGHTSSAGNKAADKMAKRSAKGSLRSPLTEVSVRKKKTEKSFQRGSVTPSGQRLTVRVITVERLNVQKIWKYKYEVVSKKSSFHGNVDLAFSYLPLRDGHSYVVQMNDDTRNPRFLKCYREVIPKQQTSSTNENT